MNINQPDKCPLCEYERQWPKHMLERALFRALPSELQHRIRTEREASMMARRKQARIQREKWRIDNPLVEEKSELTKDSINEARKEYRELKRIHEEGQCVERRKQVSNGN